MRFSQLLYSIVCGIIATITMDALNYLASLTRWINKMDPSITGRLADGWVNGKFVYDNFDQVPQVANALAKGIFAHYLIGIVCALGFILITDAFKLRRGITLSLLFGMATTVFSVLLLFPSVGMGIFALNSPMGAVLVRSSIFNHICFGLGIFLGSSAFCWTNLAAVPQYRRPI